MWPVKEIKIGDSVIILDDLANNLSLKRYVVEDIYEYGTKGSLYHYAYRLKDVFRDLGRHEIHPIEQAPVVKIYLSDGQFNTIEKYINENRKYFKERSCKVSVSYINNSAVLQVEYNFENIADFYQIASDIGRILQVDDFEIKQRDELSLESRIKQENDTANANSRWNEQQDNQHAIDDDYNSNDMRRDDEYNPQNWEGHS